MKKILISIVFLPLFSFGQIISQYVETDTGNQPKLFEIYNNTGSDINFATTNLKIYYAANAGNESLAKTISSGTLAVGQVMVVGPKTTDDQSSDDNMGQAIQNLVSARNPNAIYVERTWYFNGNDHIRLELDNNTTDTFGKVIGNSTYPSWGGVKAQNQNISRKLGIYTGDTDYLAATQTNSDNISVEWETTVDYNASGVNATVSGADADSNGHDDGLESALAGVGIPPDQYIFDGTNWRSWDSSNLNISTTTPTGSSVKPVLIASSSATIGSTGMSFPSIEIKSGATLTINASNDLKISSSADSDSYNSGKLINNGTLILASDASGYSSLRVETSMTGNLTYRRWINDISSASPSNADPGWDLVGSPVSSATVNTTSLAQNSSNNNYAIQPYNNQTDSWTSTSASTLALTDMIGYSMAMPEGSPGTIDFTGTLINSNQTVTISNYVGNGSGTQWNLVSNPYPEFIALNSAAATDTDAVSNFIWYNGIQDGEDVLGHTDSEVAIYYWDGDEYNTGTQSDAKLFAAPGSAFFVSSASGTSNSLDFRTGMRVLGSDSGLASTNDWIGDINESENRAELFVEVSQNDFRAKTELFFLNDVLLCNRDLA